MNAAGTKKWDGTKWVPVNVARDGQRATRNGKPVVRKGGKWVPYKSTTRSTHRRGSSGTTSTSSKTESKPTLKPIPASKRPKDMQAGKVYGDAGQPPAPKLPPKPSAPKPTPPKTTPPKTTPTRTRTPQKKGEGGMDANYKAWAKANPGLAKKVKKGQAGYKAIKSSSPKAASSADAQNLKSGPTPPKRTSLKTTPAKPADKKPAKQKPLTVPTNKIPKNLTGAAGKKYLADLDAGKLTRKKK